MNFNGFSQVSPFLEVAKVNDISIHPLKGGHPSGAIPVQGWDPPGLVWPSFFIIRFVEECSELSKILQDLEFSVRGLIEVSRVLLDSFSSRRNLCSELDIWLRS